MSLTTDKNDPGLGKEKDNGQNEVYLVLSDEEKAKGFVRPIRISYIHMGKEIDTSRMRELSKEEKEKYKKYDYIGFIPNEDKDSSVIGTYIIARDLSKGCGALTTMNEKIAETYARDPKFYGSTYCVGCRTHLPVSEFVWDGTGIKVGE